MDSTGFAAEGREVSLQGTLSGRGDPVLLLHGGPGLGHDYLAGLIPELNDGYRVASYQQRGLAPSTAQGPFEVADHVDDVRRVLDALSWERAVLVGHSWGGHLALHVATTLRARVTAVLAVDPLGAVGDGGAAEFEQTLEARTAPEDRARADELDRRALRGEGTAQDAIEGLRLVWPAYFPSAEAAPPMPEVAISVECYAATWESLVRELPGLEAQLPAISVPVGFVTGAASPMPPRAARDTADRIPGAWVDVVPDAGHFIWLDAPGRVRAALDRLTQA